MGLIEDNQVIRDHFRFLQAGEHRITAQGIDTDNKQITILAYKRVAYFRVIPTDYSKSEIEKRAQFMLPVAYQSRGRHDQHARNEPACQHLTNVETRHNGFSCASVIGQQEAQPALLEYVIIDGNTLVRQRVNHGDFSGEGGIKEMPIG